MLSRAVSGYSEDQVNRAMAGLDYKPTYRRRADYLDAEGALLYPLDGLILDGSIRQNSDALVMRDASLKFRATERGPQHSAPLDDFISCVEAQQRLFHLRCDDTSGNLTDYTGNGRNFSPNGTPHYSEASLVPGDLQNDSVRFDNFITTGYWSIADAAWMDVSRISLVFAFKGDGNSEVLINREDGGSNLFFRVSIPTDGKVRFILNFTTGSPTRVTYDSNAKINDLEPHLVHCTYDGAHVRIYIDGRLDLKSPETRTLTTGTLGMKLGATDAGASITTGWMDEVGMLNRALTSREIWDEYQAWSAQRNEILTDKKRGHAIRIYSGLLMPDGEYAEWPRFTGQLPTLRNDYAQTGNTLSFSCSDYSKRLADATFSTPTTLAAAANYITGTNGVLSIAQAYGFDTTSWAVTSTSKTAPADIAFDAGAGVLESINYLLRAINYAPLRFSGEGAGIVEPALLDTERTVQDAVSTTANGALQIITPENLSLELEPLPVPNKVVVFNGNPDTTPIVQEVSNTKTKNPTSSVYNLIRFFRVQSDVPDSGTATSLGTQILNDKTAEYARRLAYETLICPVLEYRDKRTHTIPEMGIVEEDFIIRSWTEPINPLTRMVIEARGVVTL